MFNWLLIFKTIQREITRHITFNSFFVLNLSLGLVGLIMINSLQDSIKLYLNDNLRNSLGGDISITSQQPITDEEQKIIKQSGDIFLSSTKKVEFFSMLNTPQSARLVNVIAIDENFPLYGTLQLLNGNKITADFSTKETQKSPRIWMLPDTRKTLGLEIGEGVSIGNAQYQIGQDISPDSTANGISIGFAPKVYVQISHLDYAYLQTRGSRINYSQLIRLKESKAAVSIAAKINDDFYQKFTNQTAPRIRTYINSNNQISNLLNRASGYISMFALIALFLSGIGAIYLYRGLITQRYTQMAIMHSLGIKKAEIFTTYTIHAFVLGATATLISLLLAFFLLPFLNQFLEGLSIGSIELQLSYKSIILGLLIGCLGSLAFCYPALQQISKVNSQSLLKFGTEIENNSPRGYIKRILPYFSVLAFILLVSIYQSSLIDGLIFLSVFSIGLIAMGLTALLLIKLCEIISRHQHRYLKIALRNIVRHRWGSMITFIVLGLGAFLLNIVPQTYQGLQHEIDASDTQNVPSLLLFDIQPEQISSLKKQIAKQQHSLASLTPMIRGRLQKIDGQAPETRHFEEQTMSRSDTQGESQNRNLFRGVNITYRSSTLPAESIFQGKAFTNNYQGQGDKQNPIEASVEDRFAKRLGIKLGSLLEFSVQGIPIYAKVVNIRKVKWNSFQPNFFIVLQPGLLEDAPQTFLATIQKTSLDNRLKLQNSIVKKFPNISIIDVTDLVKKIIDLSGKITLAITIIALFAIIVGFLVIYSISHTETKRKSNEMNLLKVLGGTQKSIYSIFIFEFGLISLLASLLGITMSIIATIAISIYLFESLWQIDGWLIIISLFLLNVLTITLTLFSARNTIEKRPHKLLQSR
jgi:putative ABC transport system permease protein